jgi:hypothetical protein
MTRVRESPTYAQAPNRCVGILEETMSRLPCQNHRMQVTIGRVAIVVATLTGVFGCAAPQPEEDPGPPNVFC